jgi:hypothetical protein
MANAAKAQKVGEQKAMTILAQCVQSEFEDWSLWHERETPNREQGV